MMRAEEGFRAARRSWARAPYLADFPAVVEAGSGFFASGTRSRVWQCWHRTSFPRTSSGTVRNFRQVRLGQSNCTGIAASPPRLSATTIPDMNKRENNLWGGRHRRLCRRRLGHGGENRITKFGGKVFHA